jgi:catechol 2,3-dioxygenase-like lactoylglutathione lyase family enzyme
MPSSLLTSLNFARLKAWEAIETIHLGMAGIVQVGRVDYTTPNEARRPTGMIRHISAVTFAVNDMARSIEFYRKLGFELLYGGERATFSSLKVGEAFVNLTESTGYEHRWWGRVIFRVDQVDAHYRALKEQGLLLESPRDAPWGERFFHLIDPDGHELSFAELLPVGY